jgi:hypothetical protein
VADSEEGGEVKIGVKREWCICGHSRSLHTEREMYHSRGFTGAKAEKTLCVENCGCTKFVVDESRTRNYQRRPYARRKR